MRSPHFLSLPDVLIIHSDQLARYGGKAGILDQGALRSALAMPRAGVNDRYLHTDLLEMAAAYVFHLVRNHPFVDGNKRTGAVAAIIFLDMNGIEVTASEDKFERMILATAEGTLPKSQIAEFFRAHSRAR